MHGPFTLSLETLIAVSPLLGHPLVGHVVAERAGHALHIALLTRLLKDKSSWTLAGSSEFTASAPCDTPARVATASPALPE